ncbi:hypothetical protein D3C71_1898790 [compost metagenome]
MLVRCVDEDLRAALEFPLRGFLDQYQRPAVGRLLEDCISVPGNVARGVTQEIVIAQLRPQLLDIVRIVAAANEDVQGCALGLTDLLFAVHRVFQAAPQCAFGLGIELAQQAGAPGIP